MSTSNAKQFLSEILNGEPIPKSKLAFFQERFRDHLYELVLAEFLKREAAGTLTRAKLAAVIHRKPEQITRWLGAPGNWELETVSDLLLAVAQSEPVVSLTPLSNLVAAEAAGAQAQVVPSGATARTPSSLTGSSNTVILNTAGSVAA
jgi:hypothetical protein